MGGPELAHEQREAGRSSMGVLMVPGDPSSRQFVAGTGSGSPWPRVGRRRSFWFSRIYWITTCHGGD